MQYLGHTKKIHFSYDIQISLGMLSFVEERQGDGNHGPVSFLPPSLTPSIRLGMVHAVATLTLLDQPAHVLKHWLLDVYRVRVQFLQEGYNSSDRNAK